MTVVEEQTAVAAPTKTKPPARAPLNFGERLEERYRRALIFGTAAAIEVGDRDLYAVLIRARPSGVSVVSQLVVADFRSRPPKEWGVEYHKWLRQHGERNLSAVVVLPRRESIVRLIAMPGVTKKDMPSAIGYQVDALHPYGDEDVAFGWSPAGVGNVLLGMIRSSALLAYVQMFQDAGIPSAGFTVSASALYAALRLYGTPPKEFLAWSEDGAGTVEVYGQSVAKPVFSAEFHMLAARALALARAELRIPDYEAARLETILPQPKKPTAIPALAYAAALAQVGAWRNPYANLLPAEKRTIRSRARYIPTIILSIALVAAAGGFFAYQQMREQNYLDDLSREISKVQPRAMRAELVDKRTADHRARIKLLDDYRKRGQGFVDVMAELTRLLPPPIWTQSVEINQDTVTIAGEADNAASLLKILDSSPLFRNSELLMGVVKVQQTESFRIRIQRRPRK